MRRLYCIVLLQCLGFCLKAQNSIIFLVSDKEKVQPLAGTSVVWEKIHGLLTDSGGILRITGIPNGLQRFSFHFIGYETRDMQIGFPLAADTIFVSLQVSHEELDAVMVSTTRTSRSIRDIPTRVELINGEELEEKANMRPGDIRMMLNESTGIQTQQTSATSANSSIRIQGLDGRYTQILKDGFPLFSGFSGGLGLLQTPPLDLKQVEIIKGSSSTLYGGGAIAGLVNLVSRVPLWKREWRFLVNGTSAKGLDLNTFYSRRWRKFGFTLYAGRSSNAAFDPSTTGFSAIPRFTRYNINPRVFLYLSSSATLTVGLNSAFENRLGGDMFFLTGHGDSVHQYYERNKTLRSSLQLSFDNQLNENNSIHFKSEWSYFKRTLAVPDYAFNGSQRSGYSELTFNHKTKKLEWVAGLNLYTDHFKEKAVDTFPLRNYNLRTTGGFIQSTWTMAPWLQWETGLRIDGTTHFGVAVLPRISVLIKYSRSVSSRIGGGMGYKTPTIFTEETERIQFRSVYPVLPGINRFERSYGANADLNYRFRAGPMTISLNQLFFFTRIRHPLLLDSLAGDQFRLSNHPGFLDSKGFETNIKIAFGDVKLFAGYTFTDAHRKENGKFFENPLAVRHRLNNVLVYEKEGKWKLGLEAYYYGKQLLNDGKSGKAYWTFGFMAEKMWERWSLFVNFENFTDVRQTRFDSIYTGTAAHPQFRDIYAPLDGFVVNGGIKLKL